MTQAANLATVGSNATAIGGATAQAWVRFTVTGTTPTIVSAFNITSVTYNSTGYYTFTFTTALPNANYTATGSSGIDTGTINFTISMCFATPGSPYYLAPTTTGFTMCYISANTQGLINPKIACVTVFGS